jgi:hypothetical protein
MEATASKDEYALQGEEEGWVRFPPLLYPAQRPF